MNQQQDMRALLRQAELALTLRYNGYFHTIIQDIQQALPNIVTANQVNSLSEQLSHFNQYNISYQPYSLSHLLTLDLSDKSARTDNTDTPSKSSTHNNDNKKKPRQDAFHTASLQPSTPTITEAF